MKYDLVIRDSLVVDPVNGVKEIYSVGMKDGKIVEVGQFLDGAHARQVACMPGMVLMPGIVDSHVHASDLLGGELSFGMMARAGVTTALDMAGPVNVVMNYVNRAGAGINMAVLNALWPNVTIKNMDPSLDECRELLKKSLEGGAIGIKLIGGHYPYTANACRNAIRAANEARVYVAWHAGSEKNGSNINGVFDTAEFAGGVRSIWRISP
jgi:N-acyl-D-aspartate/D-glutamate deacylase